MSTFKKAIIFFKSWPGLTPEVLKHLPKSVSTVQGHLHQERQNLQSTKQQPSKSTNLEAIRAYYIKLKKIKKPGQTLEDVLLQELDADSFPRSPSPNVK